MGILLALVLAVSTDAGDAAAERELAVRRAREQLAADSGALPAKITLRSAEPREWPDASLGCPRAGMLYAQVVGRGYRVALGLSGLEYVYHVSGQTAVRCLDERSQAKTGAAEPDIQGHKRAERARDDLAHRLGLAPAAVRIAAFASEASAGELHGCGDAALAGEVYRVELVVKGKRYRYRVGETSLAFCGGDGK